MISASIWHSPTTGQFELQAYVQDRLSRIGLRYDALRAPLNVSEIFDLIRTDSKRSKMS
jgi:hypothetical protein